MIDNDSEPVNAVVVRDNTALDTKQSTGFLGMEPEAMVLYATRVANVLKPIIVQQKLSIDLSGGRGEPHVKVDGWITLGSLLGILPKEEKVTRHENGMYEAKVNLVRQSDGQIISSASAICGGDERTWKNREEYARRSMAITRATGKAYRLSFGWIMHLAGYNPTPAEEMPEQVRQDQGSQREMRQDQGAVEIPFAYTEDPGLGKEKIYEGLPAQKQYLNALFKKFEVTEITDMKRIAALMFENKITMGEMESAFNELAKDGLLYATK